MGRGVEPVGERADLEFGKAIHFEIELSNHYREYGNAENDPPLLHTIKLWEASKDVQTPDGFSQWFEWCALLHGMVETFRRSTLPRLLAEYDWLASELELTTEIAPGIQWMSRLDAVLRRKADGLYFVLEAKTSSWLDRLLKSAPTNFQLLMECEALRHHLDDELWYTTNGPLPPQIGGALLLVFDKGRRQAASAAEKKRGLEGYRRLSPFTYWYSRSRANGETDYRLDYAAGFERTPVWTIPDWFELMWSNPVMRAVAEASVQVWPSVSFDTERVASVLRQIVHRELVLSGAVKELGGTGPEVDILFAQNFSNCHNFSGFGRDCEYLNCCFSPRVGADPVGSGEFQWRVPNHIIEEESLAKIT
jgi:hypothetical protein